jgi:hypothetical protein
MWINSSINNQMTDKVLFLLISHQKITDIFLIYISQRTIEIIWMVDVIMPYILLLQTYTIEL